MNNGNMFRVMFKIILALIVKPAHSLSINVYSSATHVKAGDDFSFRCQTTGKSSNDLTQIIKSRILYTDEKGDIESYGNTDRPYQISNGTRLLQSQPEFQKRYRVTKESQGLLNLKIKSAQPEDSGFWSCRVINDEDGIIIQADLINIIVVGPITSVHFETKACDSAEKSTSVLQDNEMINLTLPVHSKMNFLCHIQATNIVPDIRVLLRKGLQLTDVTDAFDMVFNTTATYNAGGLISVIRDIFITPLAQFKNLITYKHFRNDLVCRADLPYYKTEDAVSTLNISFAPQDIDTYRIVAEDQIKFSCVTYAYPVPSISWYFANGTVIQNILNYTISNQVDGCKIISNLTILNPPDDSTTYIFTAKNGIGQQTKQIFSISDQERRGSHLISSSQTLCPSSLLHALWFGYWLNIIHIVLY